MLIDLIKRRSEARLEAYASGEAVEKSLKGAASGGLTVADASAEPRRSEAVKGGEADASEVRRYPVECQN
ncbi:hypothetical protein LXL04_016665 [Taraxacum kok-saghyz]